MSPEEGKKRPPPQRAYLNQEFMSSPQARTIRVMTELTEPHLRFKKYNVRNTVVMFGSARTLPLEQARAQYDEVKALVARGECSGAECSARLRIAEMNLRSAPYYEACRELAFEMTKWSLTLPEWQRFLVCSGGGPGIMEAANRGAFDVGCKSIGLNIKLPAEQQPNPFITPELCFQFKYFALRKFHFILRAAAVVLFPGGFGTLDEMFETLTLRQTHRMQPVPIILYGRDYWSKVLDFRYLADCGVIADRHLDLFTYAETPEDAWQQILDFHAKKHSV